MLLKKFLAIAVLGLFVAFLAAGCSKIETQTQDSSNTTQETAPTDTTAAMQDTTTK